MTRGSIREYTEAIRGRYVMASKAEKSKILDEFTKVTGCHRKTAIRLLLRKNRHGVNKKRGHPNDMGPLWLGRYAWHGKPLNGCVLNAYSRFSRSW